MSLGGIPFIIPALPQRPKANEEEEDSEALLGPRESLDFNPVPLSHISNPSSSEKRRHDTSAYIKLLKRIGAILFYLITFFLALNGLYHIIKPHLSEVTQYIHWLNIPSQESDLSSCSCGNSLTEAMARSCRYDTLSATWLPPHCRDDELTAQFDASGPGVDGAWTYYADQRGYSTMSLAEIAQLPENDTQEYFYTTHHWHIMHCSFYWRKLHRMVHRVEGAAKRIEHRSDSESHIDHCEMIFLSDAPMEAIVTGSGPREKINYSGASLTPRTC
ncbi:hypothetical protein BO71DRAFT_441298 [Aspergillus ellipticus CBS 707.79]|uniref:Uncharacterized protein n=1 Tax=Aspergillus ellipticus CBS 707.79 TaxID=1448320 RepID=A0A319DA40_9EURO|nr:hypothetical protein BO71DRAFT_441298 [Aspergillus ellipticus CBS 707.79]